MPHAVPDVEPNRPASAAPLALALAVPTVPAMPAHLPKLLIVDDQPVNAQALYQVFAADHQVLVATRGEQALKLCREKQPDLVLLDVVMPGMDGFEVCTQLKADPATRDTPVIFVTGQNDEQAETRGLDVGAVDFISKPINPKVVRARVRTHLTLKAQADRLRQMVMIDGLTGAFNRRCFDERLDVELRRAARARGPIALLMFDVDHFKRYNDHHGHQAGDDCLRRIAGMLMATLRRPGDLIARYGGEEFVCILPDTGFDGAWAVACKQEQQVRALQMPHVGSDVAAVVTVSVGLAVCPGGLRMDPGTLLAQADRQLYRAKGSGRGRVCATLLDADAAATAPAPPTA